MTPNEYLTQVLKSQELKPEGGELKALQSARADVEEALRSGFPDSKPSIRYGGSKAKGTMNLDDYDLDVICYFPHDETAAGKTLEDIFNKVKTCLEPDYLVRPRTSALRLSSKEGADFHIDVVPGRFTDDPKTDAYLHQNDGSKRYLKTNLQTHINHIAQSGHTDIIRLMKLWRLRNGVSVRTFPLELLIIEILDKADAQSLEGKLTTVLTAFRDEIATYQIEDPANPQGNDLSELLNNSVRNSLSVAAQGTLLTIEASGCEAVFGPIEARQQVEKPAVLRAAVVQVPSPTRPWSNTA